MPLDTVDARRVPYQILLLLTSSRSRPFSYTSPSSSLSSFHSSLSLRSLSPLCPSLCLCPPFLSLLLSLSPSLFLSLSLFLLSLFFCLSVCLRVCLSVSRYLVCVSACSLSVCGCADYVIYHESLNCRALNS